jgi:hypothetical protein
MRVTAARSNDARSILQSSSLVQLCIILPSALYISPLISRIPYYYVVLPTDQIPQPPTSTLTSMWTWSLLYDLNSALPGWYRAVSYVIAKPFGRTYHLHHQTKGFPNSTEICGRIRAKVYTVQTVQNTSRYRNTWPCCNGQQQWILHAETSHNRRCFITVHMCMLCRYQTVSSETSSHRWGGGGGTSTIETLPFEGQNVS